MGFRAEIPGLCQGTTAAYEVRHIPQLLWVSVSSFIKWDTCGSKVTFVGFFLQQAGEMHRLWVTLVCRICWGRDRGSQHFCDFESPIPQLLVGLGMGKMFLGQKCCSVWKTRSGSPHPSQMKVKCRHTVCPQGKVLWMNRWMVQAL